MQKLAAHLRPEDVSEDSSDDEDDEHEEEEDEVGQDQALHLLQGAQKAQETENNHSSF